MMKITCEITFCYQSVRGVLSYFILVTLQFEFNETKSFRTNVTEDLKKKRRKPDLCRHAAAGH